MNKQSFSELQRIVWSFFNPKQVNAFVFGSQARGDAHQVSDVDLALEGKINVQELAQLREALEESTLPYTIDVVDMSKASEQFRLSAKQHMIAL